MALLELGIVMALFSVSKYNGSVFKTKFSGNRNGQGSYASVGAKCTENESNRNCENGQKYHGERSLPRVSGSKEETVIMQR